jgi:hypothetical protein
MQRDRVFLRDREMQRDMDRLREHLSSMAAQMESTLQTMERMQKRLTPPPEGS